MVGRWQEAGPALFYEFSLADHVPKDHLLRSIDRFVDLSSIRPYLADFYRHTGRSPGKPASKPKTQSPDTSTGSITLSVGTHCSAT